MFNSPHSFIYILIFLLSLSCGKEKIIKSEDKFVEETERLSELQAEVSAAGYQFIEVQWNPIYSTHFKSVTYSIYLNEEKIIAGLYSTSYSLINLQPGQEYSIKITASTEEGNQVQQILKSKTLSLEENESKQVFYKEYKIHSYSRITGGIGLKQLPDGGHLIVRFLQHYPIFSNETFKIIVFRIDKYGNLMWYRLLPTLSHGFTSMDYINLTLHNADKEGIVFIGGYAFKFSAVDGKILLEKDFREINESYIKSVYYASSHQIIIGTWKGSLLSIDPQDLAIQWHQTNGTGQGEVLAVSMDSQKNIYAVFRDYKDESNLHIYKYDSTGEYLTKFIFQGNFIAASLLVDKQDNFYLFPYSAGWNYIYYYKFSKEGRLIKKNTISDGVSAPKAFLNNNEIIVSADGTVGDCQFMAVFMYLIRI